MEFIYKGLKAKRIYIPVEESDVDRQIEQLIQRFPKVEVITDRPAQEGDEVILDYSGFCEGVQFEGGTAEMQPLTLGSHTFIPGFEDQLVGKAVGEPVSVHVIFPEQYPAEHLAGKPAEFKCVIHEIHRNSLWEANDEFAREIAKCENMAELRSKLEGALRGYYDEQAEQQLQTQLIDAAAATLDFEPTEEQINAAVQEQLEELTAQLSQQGLNLELYSTFTRQSMDEIRAGLRPEAKKNIRRMAAVGKIGGLEQIVPTEEDLNRAFMDIAMQNELTEEQMQAINEDQEYINAITSGVLVRKVMQFVRDAAIIED